MSCIERVYIHVPFCSSKCDYCAFYSISCPRKESIESYLEKLEYDISKSLLPYPLKSLYIGGGTPSYLSEMDLERLFGILRKFNFADNAEISIECNPGSLTEGKIDLVSDFANRISLGIQSFNNKHRQTIGRLTDVENMSYLADSFLKRNLNNISCDLIYGIPNQTIEDFENDLERLLALPIKHFSAYSLTIEENSKLNGRLAVSELEAVDSTASEIWEMMPDLISSKGFRRYEISNYSLDGYECQHNCAIWFGANYLGFGPAASSFDGVDRWTNPELPEWLNGEAPIVDFISYDKRVSEIFVMGLRTAYCWIITAEVCGVTISSPFGIVLKLPLRDWNLLLEKLVFLKELRLLEIDTSVKNTMMVRSLAKGLAFWNDVALNII